MRSSLIGLATVLIATAHIVAQGTYAQVADIKIGGSLPAQWSCTVVLQPPCRLASQQALARPGRHPNAMCETNRDDEKIFTQHTRLMEILTGERSERARGTPNCNSLDQHARTKGLVV